MSTIQNGSAPKIQRRTVLKAGAWSIPVIAAATAVPLSAASTAACVDGPVDVTALSWTSVGQLESNWTNQTTTGWIGSFRGAAGGDATENVTALTDGFLSQDDNDSATEVATVTATVTLAVVDGAQYTLTLGTAVGFGNPGGFNGSARQSLVLDVLQPDASSSELLKLSVSHYDAPTITPTDAQMGADGYILQEQSTLQNRALSFTASGTGTATLRFSFTIQPKIGANRTDDISVGIPRVTSQVCPA